jgi:hypothetical protein
MRDGWLLAILRQAKMSTMLPVQANPRTGVIGPILTHNGTNTMWYATVWLAPELDVAFLAVANQGGSAGQQSTDEAVAALIELHKSAGQGR